MEHRPGAGSSRSRPGNSRSVPTATARSSAPRPSGLPHPRLRQPVRLLRHTGSGIAGLSGNDPPKPASVTAGTPPVTGAPSLPIGLVDPAPAPGRPACLHIGTYRRTGGEPPHGTPYWLRRHPEQATREDERRRGPAATGTGAPGRAPPEWRKPARTGPPRPRRRPSRSTPARRSPGPRREAARNRFTESVTWCIRKDRSPGRRGEAPRPRGLPRREPR